MNKLIQTISFTLALLFISCKSSHIQNGTYRLIGNEEANFDKITITDSVKYMYSARGQFNFHFITKEHKNGLLHLSPASDIDSSQIWYADIILRVKKKKLIIYSEIHSSAIYKTTGLEYNIENYKKFKKENRLVYKAQ
jgi:hypothetical protein